MLADEKTGASDYIALSGDFKETPLPVLPGPLSGGPLHLERELSRRFPAQAGALRDYFTLADAVQLRFGLLIASAVFPSWIRRLLLLSPLFALWRRWAGRTGAEGLHEVIPGDEEEQRRLRSYLIGLWLDTGAPPSRGS